MAKKQYKQDEPIKIAFSVTSDEYEEANKMAKIKGFSSVEKLMENKYQKFMRKYKEL